jgi:UDP-N-acetyl-D-mannosaminuronate dehydrogenase
MLIKYQYLRYELVIHVHYHNPSVLVIGPGQIGLSDAEHMTSREINVDDYDTDARAKKMKVVILGLGNIGLSVARHVEQIKRCTAFGYDISEKAVIRAEQHGIASSTAWVSDADIYVVAVNTWFKNGNPDMSAIEDVCSARATGIETAEIIITFAR